MFVFQFTNATYYGKLYSTHFQLDSFLLPSALRNHKDVRLKLVYTCLLGKISLLAMVLPLLLFAFQVLMLPLLAFQ